ncbi:MAG: DeoR/GlpR transcriptional regulator [Promethearchaeota archaeon]|nr:MAG: DeoR/GlpR transcriptional regulator [Candidatus Lokiarchaeota archaeon]
MFAEERQNIILAHINEKGCIEIKEIIDRFSVSKMTAWRDLKILEKSGLIKKVYGGAVRKFDNIRLEPKFEDKLNIAVKQKEEIAKYAAENFIRDSDILFLEGGSTVMKMIPHLKQDNLTILTNGLYTMLHASKYIPRIRIIGCGGHIKEPGYTFIGPEAENFFKNYRANKVFISGTGFTLEEGLMDPHILEMGVKKIMCNASDQIIVLVDSTKIAKKSLTITLPVDEIDVLITDSGVSPGFIRELKKLDIDVRVVN